LQISDGVAATAGAVLRALGLHTTGALINLTSYYIIGLPFGLWLTLEKRLHLGLIGLWIGLSVALGYASVISFVLVWRANWVRAVERVRERLGLPAQGLVGEDGRWQEPGQDGVKDGEDAEEEGEGEEGRERESPNERTRLLA
jgi:MATE family multidrug resistance protein